MRSKRVGHNLATEQQQHYVLKPGSTFCDTATQMSAFKFSLFKGSLKRAHKDMGI